MFILYYTVIMYATELSKRKNFKINSCLFFKLQLILTNEMS